MLDVRCFTPRRDSTFIFEQIKFHMRPHVSTQALAVATVSLIEKETLMKANIE
jgi:hypothetical protein